jgi:carbamoyl-phosphate synthase large subunit
MAEISDCPGSFHKVPPSKHPSYVSNLIELMNRQSVAWLVPTVAEELTLVARAAPLLRAAGVAVYIPRPRATAACSDKWQTVRRLSKCGVAVPRSALGPEDSSNVAELGFPRLSKPRFGRGGRGVVVHDGPGTKPAQPISLWQKFLPGAEFVAMLVLPADCGVPLVIGVFEKLGLREGRTGNATAVRRVEAPDVEALALAAAQALSLSGPLDIDIRCDADGTPHVLEINPRIGAHILKFEEGVDALVRLHAEGQLG